MRKTIHAFFLILFFSTSPLFSECSDDFCSFDNKQSLLSFYGSESSYRFYEDQNIDRNVFELTSYTSSIDNLIQAKPDAAFFTCDENKINELCLKSSDKASLYLMGQGQLNIVGNSAFLKALKKDTVTTQDLQSIALNGKLDDKKVIWYVFDSGSPIEMIGWKAILDDTKEIATVEKIETSPQKAFEQFKEFIDRKEPCLCIIDGSLVDFYQKDSKWSKLGLKQVKWQGSPSISYYIAVLKGVNYDTIISNLKSMKAKPVSCN